ncbi:MAG TPA: peptidase M23 [Leptospiraceae bacterium]|nr:peptidase M23 [Spirochaetaceae bacterium]HBS03771.1 peptidase M23 [Leptospiraceae bacterium]|tara:strand:+ start:23696 stop:24487 length:792 start_codon:yes stop_codon:yes gene_type:complete
MRKALISIFAALMLSTSVFAGQPEEGEATGLETVTIDNKVIQVYNGVIGRWEETAGQSLNGLAHRFGTTVQEIYKVNRNDVGGEYVFVPMSKEFYAELIRRGYGRRILQVDSRKLIWPVETPNRSSGFGNRFGGHHNGLDFACPSKTIVVAAMEGTVIRSQWMGGFGNAVVIRHKDGTETTYAHNTKVLVRLGDEVQRGQVIALSGNTGRSTGPHVHLEVRYENVPLDPEDFLQYGLARPETVVRERLEDQPSEASALNLQDQ